MGKFLVKDTPRVSTGNQDNAKPDQLNRYFRDQIHSLTLENGGLRRALEEAEAEISSLKQRLSKAPQTAPVGRVAETADYKIAQLSRRLREQNAEMESLRTQAKEAEAKLRRLEARATEQEKAPSVESPSELAEKEQQIKALTDKLQATSAKMCDFRNQYQSLKQEMKLAQKVIENEIGEKCSIQDLAKEGGGSWRGRAQQILTLQNRVQMLQEQLNNSTTATENPASSVLRQMERDRRASHEETSKQLNLRTIQLEEVKKKLEAAKARNKVLENEIVQVKTKLSALTEKGARDEHLLTTLTSQINAFEDRGKSQMQCFFKMQENLNKIQKELELERTKGEQLQRALSDREARIRRMEDQIDELRKKAKNKSEDPGEETRVSATADKATDTGLPPDRMTSSNIADAERMRLLELLGVVNKRLEEARRDQSEAESQLRKERYKNAKLDTKIARLELEKVGAMKNGRGSYSHGISKIGDTNEADIWARQHIEYLEEECLALKTRIETLQMEKESDLKMILAMSEGKAADGRLQRGSSASPDKVVPAKGNDKGRRLNRKKLHRSPANTVRSSSIRQSSFSSEDFRYYEKPPETTPVYPNV